MPYSFRLFAAVTLVPDMLNAMLLYCKASLVLDQSCSYTGVSSVACPLRMWHHLALVFYQQRNLYAIRCYFAVFVDVHLGS
jgi:hypothetical protein